jgi:hypothetical protein
MRLFMPSLVLLLTTFGCGRIEYRPIESTLRDGGSDSSSRDGGIDSSVQDGGMDSSVDDGGMDSSVDDGGMDSSVDDGGMDSSVQDGEVDSSLHDGGEVDSSVSDGGEVDALQSDSATSSGYEWRKVLRIPSANIRESQVDMPVLVAWAADADMASRVRADGSDIAFFGPDGELLNHEVERYESSTGGLVAWVRIPVLSAGSDFLFSVAFGDPAGTAPSAPDDVYAEPYRGVWHLGDTSRADDSSPYASDGTLTGRSGITEGPFGPAQRVGGSLGYVRVPDPADGHLDFSIGESFSVSLWVFIDGQVGDWQTIFEKGGLQRNEPGYGIEVDNNAARGVYGCISNGAGSIVCTTTVAVPLSTWAHVVYVVDRTRMALVLYVNGVGSEVRGVSPLEINPGPGNMHSVGLGATGDLLEIGLTGGLDEVSVRRGALSAGRIMMEYENQRNPESFVIRGSLERLE